MAGHGGTSLENNKDDWPEEIILCILASLPAKSLLRFKCVSKHWQSLIINPYFIEQHLQNQQKKDNPQLVFASKSSVLFKHLELTFVDVEVVDEGGAKTRIGVKRSSSYITYPLYCCHFRSNSCDGILCIFTKTSVIVCNPATREHRIVSGFSHIPSRTIEHFGEVFPVDFVIGFGRDQVTKVCKIIRLFRPKQQIFNYECQVFSLSSHAVVWRGLGKVAYFIRSAQVPVYLNGALHWILDARHVNFSEVIVLFDLHTEKFQVISHPNCCLDRRVLENMHLVSLKSSLGLIEGKYDMGRQLDIWIMNQSNGIWEKLFSIHRNTFPTVIPIAELKDGTYVVLCCRTRLQIFDPKNQSYGEELIKHERWVDYYACSESLVPLYGEPL